MNQQQQAQPQPGQQPGQPGQQVPPVGGQPGPMMAGGQQPQGQQRFPQQAYMGGP